MNDVIIIGLIYKSFMRGRIIDPKGLCHTLDTCSGGGHEPKILIEY